MKTIITTMRYETPCGLLLLGSAGDRLCICDWLVERHHAQTFRRLRQQLGAEFTEGTSSVIEQAALFNDGLADLSGLGAKHDGVIVEDPFFAMDESNPEKRNLSVRIDVYSVIRIELRNGSLLLAA